MALLHIWCRIKTIRMLLLSALILTNFGLFLTINTE